MHETDTAIFFWLKISSDVSEEELALRKMIRFWTVELVASSLSCSNNRVCCSGACDFIILPKSSLSPPSGALPLFFVKSVLVAFSFSRLLQMCFLWMTFFPFLSEICVRTDPANNFLYNFLIQRYTKTFAWGVYIFIERSHVYSAADILMEGIRDYFLGNVVVVVFLDCCVSFANYYMLV